MLKLLPLGFSIAQICYVSYGISISLSHLLVKILVHNLLLVNFETGGLEILIQFGRNILEETSETQIPPIIVHDDAECDMSRAAAEKKQRKVLQNAQKKLRAAEAKAEKARQRAAAAAAAEVWSGTGHRHPCDLTAIILTKSLRIKVTCSKILDVYTIHRNI